MKRRRIEITVETEQVIILREHGLRQHGLRARGERITDWCPVCAESVQMLAAAEANALLGLAPQEIDDQVHFTEMPDGTLRLCLNSLLNSNLINKGDLL